MYKTMYHAHNNFYIHNLTIITEDIVNTFYEQFFYA